MPSPRCWRFELAERKIRVNATMPGYSDTEGARAIGVRGSEQEAQLIAATPLEKRPAHPSDLSPVAIFLASRASAWMTGEILTVSGGNVERCTTTRSSGGWLPLGEL